ncbi:hypothetical protein [Azospirillum canadense]|uniref:hypothetical protein n=1 Tax=Azospirillum canadense TaxID=403962 RepID=UPI0022271FA5|nr:hypothetical protein [Azospirillum canadense]MCW2242572.1 hypothetical protein [Azospirillum canadense]
MSVFSEVFVLRERRGVSGGAAVKAGAAALRRRFATGAVRAASAACSSASISRHA